jgi:hypothetical protein
MKRKQSRLRWMNLNLTRDRKTGTVTPDVEVTHWRNLESNSKAYAKTVTPVHSRFSVSFQDISMEAENFLMEFSNFSRNI